MLEIDVRSSEGKRLRGEGVVLEGTDIDVIKAELAKQKEEQFSGLPLSEESLRSKADSSSRRERQSQLSSVHIKSVSTIMRMRARRYVQ